MAVLMLDLVDRIRPGAFVSAFDFKAVNPCLRPAPARRQGNGQRERLLAAGGIGGPHREHRDRNGAHATIRP
jgi:hypothetical protein